MFGFLKKKLKETVEKFSKKAEEEGKDVPKEETKEILIENPVDIIQEKEKILVKKEQKIHIEKEEEELEYKEERDESQEEKKEEGTKKRGFFAKIKEKVLTRKLDDDEFEEFFSDLELVLLENNVAVEVIDKIKEDLKMDLVNVPLKRNEIEKIIESSLRKSIDEILSFKNIDLINEIKNKKEKPYVIVFFGINGSGKTTNIAKLTSLLIRNKLKCVLVAGDTWRKAAIEQLEEWGEKLNVKVIKQKYGSDPAAVSYDGRKFCEAHNIDVLLIDTAGRQHSNVNLVQEMKKIVRVAKPDLKIFVGEALTGNDVIIQAQNFNKEIGIDSIILTKADVDEKGGAMLSVSYVTGKPIIYLGCGQSLNDLKEFNKYDVIKNLGL